MSSSEKLFRSAFSWNTEFVFEVRNASFVQSEILISAFLSISALKLNTIASL
jgi:hypothetical protein